MPASSANGPPGNSAPLRCTRHECGSYRWGSVPLADLQSGLPLEYGGDHHGAKYDFLLDDERPVQDPAAGWVEHSSSGNNSRLVNQSHFQWHDDRWQTPTWNCLTVYQIRPKRFTDRFPGDPPLVQVAKEVAKSADYLRGLGVAALLLMPVAEVGSNNSRGSNPAYFHAVEGTTAARMRSRTWWTSNGQTTFTIGWSTPARVITRCRGEADDFFVVLNFGG